MNSTKKLIAVVCFLFISVRVFGISSKDSLGLAGDHLDLYATLDLFKKSESPQAFEKSLNDKNTGINNLDLNNDGEVDYIRVIDKGEGDNHALVLQDVINDKESQDVAVIEIQKRGNDEAHIQIVGDEDLYGKDYIIEPGDEQQASKETPPPPPPSAPSSGNVHTTVFVNVWPWRPVRYIYGPAYRVWISPWGWHHYPVYWRPWHPVVYHAYYTRVQHYHYPYYHRTVVYRVKDVHNVYYGHRTTSPTYQQNRTSYNRHVDKHGYKKNKQAAK
jgi:hypothetical protein